MFDEEIKSIGLFFFFALLDERRAIQASSKAVDLFYTRIKKNPQANPRVIMVMVTQQIWHNTKSNFYRGRPHYSTDSGWRFPDDLDLAPWKEFQKSSSEDELLVVIWSHILKISDENISAAIGVSQGTLRYRLGRALRKLGGMTQTMRFQDVR